MQKAHQTRPDQIRSSDLVDVLGDGERDNLSLSVRVRSRAILSLLVEVEHDDLRLVLDFVDAVADLLKEVNVTTCLLERLSNLFIENIGISRLI